MAKEILIVTSKVKRYIKEKGCNTSSDTAEVLSDAVKALCDKGVEKAKASNRKTVMARDIDISHI